MANGPGKCFVLYLCLHLPPPRLESPSHVVEIKLGEICRKGATPFDLALSFPILAGSP